MKAPIGLDAYRERPVSKQPCAIEHFVRERVTDFAFVSPVGKQIDVLGFVLTFAPQETICGVEIYIMTVLGECRS